MGTSLLNYLPALPEFFVLVMACVTLLSGVFAGRWRDLPFYLVQITLVIAACMTAGLWQFYFANEITYAFGQMFVYDPLSVILKLVVYLVSFVVFAYSHHYNQDRHISHTEFYVLGLLSVLGMMVLVSAYNFLPLYLGLELFSLPIYAMVALQRAKPRCIEAAMKYFVIGAVASAMLLYGLSMLFGATQSLNIVTVAEAVHHMTGPENLILVFGLVFVMAGIAFKFGAAPFHMWVPDVYDGAPTSVTLFLSSAPKIAAFGLAVRLLVEAMPGLQMQWQEILIVIGVLSIALGNIVAIIQSNIKRMLAYSSIAHMGYMILGLACATPRGEAAALFYMISYVVMNLGAFGMVIIMSHAGFEANEFDDFRGLNSRNPWLAFMMLMIMFSLAGVPPLVGFMAKVGILEALIKAHLIWLAVYAIVFAIIGVYYYIRLVKVMYFEEPKIKEAVVCKTDTLILATVNGLTVLLMGIFPGALFTLCHVIF